MSTHLDRYRIEAALTGELECAKAAYQASKSRFQKAVEHGIDVGMQTSDGATAVRQALREHNMLLERYSKALEAFNRFVLDGKVPERLKNNNE